jgi:protein phosphatase
MELWGISDSGRVRRQNQDIFKYLIDNDRDVALVVVCDGMGGARAGDVASAIAAEEFMRCMWKHVDQVDDRDVIASNMSDAVQSANRAVYEKSLRNPELSGMGTTLTAVISTSSGLVIVNVGDSRVYHITLKGIKQITKDHSVVEDMISKGNINRSEARRHPKKNLITRALGINSHEELDVFFLRLKPDEYILLCTDGLSNVVMDSEILFQMQSGGSVRECCEKLVGTALSRGAPDNVTAVLFKK